MAYHSYIEYRGARKLIADGALDVMAKTVAEWAGHQDDEAGRWLGRTCYKWAESMLEMPPGLRDLDLDDYLTTAEQREYFARAIREVKNLATRTGPDFLIPVCEDILELLESSGGETSSA